MQNVSVKEIMVVVVFGYLILISILLQLYFSVFFFVLVSIEKIYQTLKTEFDHISEHLKVRQKYSTARRIIYSLPDVWECGQTPSYMFDINKRKKKILFTKTVINALNAVQCTLNLS